MFFSPAASAFALKPTAIPTQNANITIAVSVANPVVQPGDAFDVNITIKSDTPSRGAQAEIAFDPKLIQVVSVAQGDYYKNWAQANHGNSVLQPPKPAIDNDKGLVALMGVVLIGGTVGQGPTGSGTLLVLHAKAQAGVSGAATISLDKLIVADTGDATGTSQRLGGVKVQNGVVTIGSGQAAATPTAQAVTAVPALPTQVEATVAPRGAEAPSDPSSSGGFGSLGLLLLAVPVVGAVVIGGGVVVVLRRRR